MYGRYTQELGVYAKEEAARLRESGQRRSLSDRSRTLDLLEYDKGRCAKCRSKFQTTGSILTFINKQRLFRQIHLKWKLILSVYIHLFYCFTSATQNIPLIYITTNII